MRAAWPVKKLSSCLYAPVKPDGSAATHLARATPAAARDAMLAELRKEARYYVDPGLDVGHISLRPEQVGAHEAR